eukprot:1156265-Pelagomonas_calceolata.AAC.4
MLGSASLRQPTSQWPAQGGTAQMTISAVLPAQGIHLGAPLSSGCAAHPSCRPACFKRHSSAEPGTWTSGSPAYSGPPLHPCPYSPMSMECTSASHAPQT